MTSKNMFLFSNVIAPWKNKTKFRYEKRKTNRDNNTNKVIDLRCCRLFMIFVNTILRVKRIH